MKRYIKYFLLTVLAFSSGACKEEFLDFIPEDQATVGGWYRNAKEIRQATATLYGNVWWQVTDQFGWLTGDVMPGDLFHNWDAEGQFYYMSFNESSQYLGEGWQGYYNVISYANLIIDDMPSIAKGYGVSDADITLALAEARFFRGYAYFMLVEHWGEVPIIEKPAEKVLANMLKLPKNTASSVYEFARRDLVFAAANLLPKDEVGRVTSWAAKGMLAKLHVTLGQHSVGGDGIGSAQDFTTAADYAADVINNSGLELYSDYEAMFRIENEHNPEVLFAPQAINGGWSFGSSRQTRFSRSPEVSGPGPAWGGGKGMSVSYINNVKNNAGLGIDKRRRAIFMQLGDKYDYLNKAKGGYTYQIVSKDDEGATLEPATSTLTSLKKQIIGGVDDHSFVITDQDSPMDIYFLRLADVYLLYAEALLGGSSSLSSGPGYEKYLEVRKRAGLLPPSDNNMTYADLFNERRVEFGLESQGWLDVKRRYYRNAQDVFDYLNNQKRTHIYFRINSSDALENDPAGYELLAPGQVRTEKNDKGELQYNNEPNIITISHGQMTLPIPATEVVANPLLRAEEPAIEYVFK